MPVETKILTGPIEVSGSDPARTYPVPSIISSNVTPVANTGTGASDLMSGAIPANTMGQNGDRMLVTGHFFIATGGDAQFRFDVDGEDPNADGDVLSHSSPGPVDVTATLIRLTTTTLFVTLAFAARNADVNAGVNAAMQYGLDGGAAITVDFTAAIPFKFLCLSASGSSAIIQKAMFAEFKPAVGA
jgi:hypothetical protein